MTRTQQRRQKAIDKGVCVQCEKTPPETGKQRCSACLRYHVEYNRKNAATINPKKKLYREQNRAEVIAKYGGECECCHEKRIEFLAIDHRNKDGGEERRRLFGRNNSGSYAWYLRLKREPVREDLRVLCHCCNISISFYGYCPHEKERNNKPQP
jgi:hypothetical protein